MLTRRQFLSRTAAAGVATLGTNAAGFAPRRRRPRLRVLGTHVTLQEPFRLAAQADLGIDIEFSPGGSASVLHQASTRPESFDVYEQWSNSISLLWRAHAIQPIDTGRIGRWPDVNALSKTGRLTPSASIGAGAAPHTLLYAQNDGSLDSSATDRISYLPYVHNVDSFGYDTRVIPPGRPYEDESWGWLLDEQWRGKVSLVNEPTIGLFDAALAARATGLMDFADIGNMTVPEIDRLFEILIDLKRNGHFAGVWNSVPQSVRFMESGRTAIESMFSPGASVLRANGVPVRYAAPREGYRAWHGVMCLSSAASEEAADAAYAYMNWWLSGKAGAAMAREGYYLSVPDAAREHMSSAEWDYWYGGKPASTSLRGPNDRVIAEPGEVRNGGSYEERFSHVAVWNTVMDNYEHTLLRWGDFLTISPPRVGV